MQHDVGALANFVNARFYIDTKRNVEADHIGYVFTHLRGVEIGSRSLAQVLAVNSIGPSLVAKHFLPKLRRDRKAIFASLSARVGSIGDNRLGGWTAYRMSKAALNMLVRTMAIEQARTAPDSVVVALHPGTVMHGAIAAFHRRSAGVTAVHTTHGGDQAPWCT